MHNKNKTEGNLLSIFPNGFDYHKWLKPQVTIIDRPDTLFAEHLTSLGYRLSGPVLEGEIVRIEDPTDKKRKRSGWYIFHTDGQHAVGVYGTWKDSDRQVWRSYSDSELSPAELSAQRERIERLAAQAAAERQASQDIEAIEAQREVRSFSPADPNHPYLVKKGIRPSGALQCHEWLVVPMYSMETGDLRSYQCITPSFKQFRPGCGVAGCYYRIGSEWTYPTFLCEGFATGATIHELTGYSVCVAFNAGNLAKVLPGLQRECRYVICAADNDRFGEVNTGLEKAKALGIEYVVPEFSGDVGTDFNDLAAESADECRNQLLKLVDSRKEAALGLFVSDLDLGPVSAPNWLVKDYLEQDTLSLLWGDSGTGKSFLAIDLGMHIAAGMPWNGCRVSGGAVLYIAGEGQGGLNRRLKAWRRYHNVQHQLPFYVASQPVQLLSETDFSLINLAIDSMNMDVSMIVIDTVNRCMGGDENSNVDMTAFLRNLDLLRSRTGACVLCVHHGAKSGLGPRGHSSLNNGSDSRFLVTRHKDDRNVSCLEMTHQKDGLILDPVCFHRTVVDLGVVDSDGDAVTSVVMVQCDEPEPVVPAFNPSVDVITADACLSFCRTVVGRMVDQGKDPVVCRDVIFREFCGVNNECGSSQDQVRKVLVKLEKSGDLVRCENFAADRSYRLSNT